MPKIGIQPIIYNENWHRDITRILVAILKAAIYQPILDLVADPGRADNAKHGALEKALRDGRIQFTQGTFRGKLDARISKDIKELGGRFSRGAWRLASPSLPPHLQAAIADNVRMMAALEQKAKGLFDNMPKIFKDFMQNMNLRKMGLETLDRVSIEFKHRLNKTISLYPDIGEKGKINFNLEYYETATKPIKEDLSRDLETGLRNSYEDFAYEEIVKLRRDLHDYILGGRPRQEIRDFINSRLDVGATRAKFIARQETALMTVSFTKQQYKGAGVNSYEWITVGDHIVRGNRPKDSGNHKVLHGNIYQWDNPPSAEHFSTGDRCNPGEDYNCRCQAKPIVEW